jgi:hypothetical protein
MELKNSIKRALVVGGVLALVSISAVAQIGSGGRYRCLPG